MGHIVLIGPIGVGKSTVAPLVAAALDRPTIDVDELRGGFYGTLGYDNAEADEMYERDGVLGLAAYWKPFEIALVEHVVTLQPDSVLDFGAGHSHFDSDDTLFERASVALAPHHVVLLLPSEDPDESAAVLDARQPEEYRSETRSLNVEFLRSRSNALLADRIVITGDRSPEAVADDVVAGWARRASSDGPVS